MFDKRLKQKSLKPIEYTKKIHRYIPCNVPMQEQDMITVLISFLHLTLDDVLNTITLSLFYTNNIYRSLPFINMYKWFSLNEALY